MAQPKQKTSTAPKISQTYKSPLGTLLLTWNEQGLEQINILKIAASKDKQSPNVSPTTQKMITTTIQQLDEYFAQKRTHFKLKINPQGTPFQMKVWQELQTISFGKLTTYGNLAQQVGSPKAARAIGGAVGKNPLFIVIPCHRVVASNNKLGGFSAGLPAKKWLLTHEKSEGLSKITNF